jgi:hypothetical protein
MEIGILYSKKNSSRRQTVEIVRKAVRNLGIMAEITEMDSKNGLTRIIVDGYDLTTQLIKPGNGAGGSITYDSIVRALEQTAW